LLSRLANGKRDLNPPITTERLFIINQIILNVENVKREWWQTLVTFLEYAPAIDQELLEQWIQSLLNGIRTLEEQIWNAIFLLF